MTIKKRYIIGENPTEGKTPWIGRDELKDKLRREYGEEVAAMITGWNHDVLYFGGRFGGVGAVATGAATPKIIDLYGTSESEIAFVQGALENLLDRKLNEKVEIAK